MTAEEIRAKFEELDKEVTRVENEIKEDAHTEFINSLKQYVNKY